MSRKILNLESLLYENRSKVRNKMKIFESTLESCHAQIKRQNTEFKQSECLYSIPLFITGIPVDEMGHLRDFLLNSLRDNGLYCKYLSDTNQIYISWKEEDIDIARYFNLKKSIDNEINHVNRANYQEIKSGKVIIDTDPRSILSNGIVINKKKEKHAKYAQYERERQFQRDIQNVKINPVTYEDFIRKF